MSATENNTTANEQRQVGHTPTPWRAFDLGRDDTGHAFTIHDMDDADGRSEQVAMVYGEANAAFIVKAVNAHEGLVEALTRLLDTYKNAGGKFTPMERMDAITAARAALDGAK